MKIEEEVRKALYSIEELYRAYEKPIFRYFYGLTTNYHWAEELTQETFFQVVRTIPSFRQDSQVTTWLYKVARNVFSMWKRKKDNYLIPLDFQTIEVPNQWEPSAITEQRDKISLLLKVLRNLPENYREVLWLREWQELSYEEIAVITSHSISWVKVTLHRARINFRQLYGEEEDEK